MSGPGDIFESIYADPPQTHPLATGGVWGTDRKCYEFIASNADERSRTIETGCGVSTAVFAAVGAQHLCVVPSVDQERITREYCRERGISTTGLAFDLRPSAIALPDHLNDGALDLGLIDGRHGFPTPIIDWYYIGTRLKHGGIVILDDTNLRQVTLGLLPFLTADPRWEEVGGGSKWRAFRKLDDHTLDEEFDVQGFVGRPRVTLRTRVIHAIPKPLLLRLSRLKSARHLS